jgi:hypothetical protein
MDAGIQFGRISGLIPFTVKRKALQAAPLFLWRARSLQHSRGLYEAGVHAIRTRFPTSPARHVDVLVYYLLARVAITHSELLHPANLADDLSEVSRNLSENLDSMNDLGQMTSSRLQMAMDRQSKFVEALSNLMKTISQTEDSVVQNLK